MKIDSYEIDSTVYKDLVINTKPFKNIKTHNEDSTTMLSKFYDLVLIDPPWGGDEYKQGVKDDDFKKYK